MHVNENSINAFKSIRPAGDSRLSSQNSHSSKDPDRLEHEQQIMANEKGANIRDLDTPEIMEVKQAQPRDLQSRPPVGTQGRNLKEISRNMCNPIYNSCDQCGYIADEKNELLIHLQNYYKDLEREKLYKMESGIQNWR